MLFLNILFVAICFGISLKILVLMQRAAQVDSGMFPQEVRRKLFHIYWCLLALLFYSLPYAGYNFCLYLGISLGMLLLMHSRGVLPYRVKRETAGDIYLWFGIALGAYFFWSSPRWFYLCVLLLAFADSAAALGGLYWQERFTPTVFQEKSFVGSVCFLVVACVVVGLCFGYPLTSLVLMALAFTFVELISVGGLDNISLPLAAVILMRVVA